MNLYINEDNLVEWDGLNKAANDEYVNDAVVTFTLKDSDGVALATAVSMPYVAASDGLYQGILNKTIAALLVEGDNYTYEMTATSGTFDGFRKVELPAEYHGEE